MVDTVAIVPALAAQGSGRGLIWRFHRDPTARRRAEMRARVDRIFKRETGFVMPDRTSHRTTGADQRGPSRRS